MSKSKNTRRLIHVDTEQEIQQAKDRSERRDRNPETGEIMPVAVATLTGGDGEGLYVSSKMYVQIEVVQTSSS